MARILAFILWLLSFLVVWPVAAQQPGAVPAAVEHTAPMTADAGHARPADEPVSLGDALRSACSTTDLHKGRKLLLWFRQRAERHIKVTVS